jgi:c-di-GMP-binding flagellar brake protein YcgR
MPRHVDTVQLQRIVDDLKARLGIPYQVTVAIVDRNPLMASVAPVSGGGFALSFEAGFAEHLTEDELTAVIAHELGHVWIFTHFPFLQTEQLANEIAMRVVRNSCCARRCSALPRDSGLPQRALASS